MPSETPQPSDPTFVIQLVDERMLSQCRQVMEAILVCLRGQRYRREVPPALLMKVQQLPPAAYQWHWLAWRMQGFRRGSQLGYTEDGRVYVYRDGAAWIGDPNTQDIVQLGLQTPAVAVSVPAPTDLPVEQLDALDTASDLIH